ncbi:unnamed protein product [Fraxinus pennsylvanica]|uniref:Pentatricopeptide repeat-containing protein n=1 Tax=Fraxinus pennsylvanica TaxID=56036 RepID=A0AAD2A2T8_9LAMI|nr:unnamed protein product [Fraxinus pennsylvanica]
MQKQRWYIADNGVYSKLISVMGKKGQTRMAMWLFSEMRNSGCRPDTSVYNALITAHLHSRDKSKALAKALGYFDKMKGMERCKPSVVTYNILLRAFAQAKNVDQVNVLFKDLNESIMAPDIFTFNGVMDAYGKNGMIREMELFPIDSSTYKLLYKAYTKADMKELLQKLLTCMDRDGIIPNKRFFLDALGAIGSSPENQKSADRQTVQRHSDVWMDLICLFIYLCLC